MNRWLYGNTWWLVIAAVFFVFPALLFAWPWACEQARWRIAARSARTQRAYVRQARKAKAQAGDWGEMSASEYVQWRRITGMLANGELAKTEGRR